MTWAPDRVIDYTAEDFTKDELTLDVVLDTVGKSSFGGCRRLLKPGGIYLSSDLGSLAQNPIFAFVTRLTGGRWSCSPSRRGTTRSGCRASGR